MVQAFTRIDDEILRLENLSAGSRLTTGNYFNLLHHHHFMRKIVDLAEAWHDHLHNITLHVDDTSTMSIHDRAALLMEPISEIDEQSLDEIPSTPSTSVDREQSDIIKVKNVCKCR